MSMDEQVTEALQREIQQVIASYKEGEPIGYFIKRDTYYLGSHWPYQDKVERLFLRTALRGWHGTLHETPLYVGTVGTLTNPLVHRTHRTLEEMVAKKIVEKIGKKKEKFIADLKEKRAGKKG